MDNVRCYFRNGKALARVDVSGVESYGEAIMEVEVALSGVLTVGDRLPTVLAVVHND